MDGIEEEVIVRPLGGMQLSEGYIRKNAEKRFVGNLPGVGSFEGTTVDEVLTLLNQKAKAYYGDDVVVDIAPHLIAC
ncbi:MAG: hypothetical protein HKP10_03215 [Kiritimatiellales bacterium]|nr:hypothetical protein [Kiritimatiellales bacterium]